MSSISSPISPRHALGAALTNDSKGQVSAGDARKIKDAVVAAVMNSSDPQKTYDEGMKVVSAAKDFVSRDKNSSRRLNNIEGQGRTAIATRLSQLSGEAVLPLDIGDQLASWLRGSLLLDDGKKLAISDVTGSGRSGYSFKFDSGDVQSVAHAKKFDGEWVITPEKMTKKSLEKAVEAAQKAYDDIASMAGFADVSVEIAGAEWINDAGKMVLIFSHGAPDGGLLAEYDVATKSWDAWEEQM